VAAINLKISIANVQSTECLFEQLSIVDCHGIDPSCSEESVEQHRDYLIDIEVGEVNVFTNDEIEVL
jgi:hypothetical protein